MSVEATVAVTEVDVQVGIDGTETGATVVSTAEANDSAVQIVVRDSDDQDVVVEASSTSTVLALNVVEQVTDFSLEITAVEPTLVEVAEVGVVFPNLPPLGTRTLSYSGDGKLASMSLPDGNQRIFSYNTDGLLSTIVTQNDSGATVRTRTLTYTNSRLTSVTDS